MPIYDLSYSQVIIFIFSFLHRMYYVLCFFMTSKKKIGSICLRPPNSFTLGFSSVIYRTVYRAVVEAKGIRGFY